MSSRYSHVAVGVLKSGAQELSPEAEIVNVRFTKSVIASKSAFTYEEAQLRKDDPYVCVRTATWDLPH